MEQSIVCIVYVCDLVGWPQYSSRVSQISCVLYVAPAKSQCVRGAIHRPASRDRHPTISHTSVGDGKINLSWVAEKQNAGESVGWKATSVGLGKEMETHLWMRLSYYYYYYCYFFENCVRCCVRCPLLWQRHVL